MMAHPATEETRTPKARATCPLACGISLLLRWAIARLPNAVRAALLVAIAFAAAAAFNAANPLGIRWRLPPDKRVGLPRAYESRLPQIAAAQALSLLVSGEALFVDSRDAEEYEKDHIPGAVNVPMRKWNDFEPKIASLLPRDRTLVLYCYGAHCGLSTRQGKRLLALGYDKLLVLDYGWATWTKAGNPTVRHPAGRASGDAGPH